MTEPNDPRTPRPAGDEAIDEALDAAVGRRRPGQDLPLKKQWDDELEAELEAALSGFDPDTFHVSPDRDRPSRRGLAPKGTRGREGDERRDTTQKGRVISVRGKSVFVDLGAKSEGVVPVDQFGADIPAPGAMIDVVVDRFDTDEGILLLSLKGAAVEANWENLRPGLVVEAKVTKTNKGGLDVEVDGIRGFLPIGQIELGRVEDTSTYVGQKLKVVVTEANQRERNLVVSRRELLEKEREELREKTWSTLEEGQVRHGVIRSVKDYGAFVDLGGVDGLLHVSDMSWVRKENAAELVKIGQEVDVKVLKIDRTTSKISLGLKQLTTSPWDDVQDKYGRGDVVTGKVTRIMDFGAFVELEPGVEGLIHVTELGAGRVRRASDVVKPEQEVEVRVLRVEPEVKRISLSLRPLPAAAAQPEPAEEPDAPPAPKPERKVPLKGGLGDREPDPFSKKKG